LVDNLPFAEHKNVQLPHELIFSLSPLFGGEIRRGQKLSWKLFLWMNCSLSSQLHPSAFAAHPRTSHAVPNRLATTRTTASTIQAVRRRPAGRVSFGVEEALFALSSMAMFSLGW
jgi:hypothetical protein